MSELATTPVPSAPTPSPRQQFKARLKLKSSSTDEASGGAATTPSNNDHRWKRKYDLAVKHPLAKHLSVQGKNPSPRNTPSSTKNISTTPSSETEDDEHQQQHSPASTGAQQQQQDFASASSADDSIIRRVEEEIAAARKAASGVVHNSTRRRSSPRDVSTTTSSSSVVDRRDPQQSAADDAAMELLHNEFTPTSVTSRDGVEHQTSPPAVAENIFFSDEEWQTTASPAGSPKKQRSPDAAVPAASPKSETSEKKTLDSVPSSAAPPQDTSASNCSEMMMEPPNTTERNIVDGKDTYVFRLVRNLRPSDAPAASSKSSPSDEQAGTSNDDDDDDDEEVKMEDTATKKQQRESPEKKRQQQVQPSPPPMAASPKSKSPSQETPATPEETTRNHSSISSIDNNNSAVPMTPKTVAAALDAPFSSSGSMADQSLVMTASKKDMDRQRTKELLGSLKEQRNVMSATTPGATSSTNATPTRRNVDRRVESPRSPANHFTFSRANRARERVKTASKSGGLGRNSPRDHHRRSPRSSALTSSSTTTTTSSPRTPGTTTSRTTPRLHRKKPHFPDHAEHLPSKKRSGKLNTSGDSTSYDDPKLSRRIRFRNPFPVLKPPVTCRSAERILADNAIGTPDAPIRWVKPKRELKQLIVAAMGTSLPRRSNACGALKVLLARQKKNQLALVRTDGFLSALIFAASQSLVDGVDRELALVARTRAVHCLKLVSEPKDNRVLMTNHPGVLECLVKVMKSDGGEGRALSSAALAMLAKTATCREGLARVEGLVDAAAKVMNGATSFIAEEMEPLNDDHEEDMLEEEDEPTRAFTESESDFTRSDLTGQHTSKSDDHDEDATAISESSMSDEEEEGETVMGEKDQNLEVTPSWQKSVPMTDSIRFKAEENQQEFTNQGRANACAILLHLSKQCVISVSQIVPCCWMPQPHSSPILLRSPNFAPSRKFSAASCP